LLRWSRCVLPMRPRGQFHRAWLARRPSPTTCSTA
jgi:hypothetical protein